MINVYAGTDKAKKKQYTAINVRHGTAKNGSPYTTFTISDNKKDANGNWQSEYYTVFVWSCLNLNDKDKIEFREIQALEVEEKIYNGNKRVNRTIFAEVDIVGRSQPTVSPIEFEELSSDSDLPF
jgi:hypothetical protein